MPSAAYCRTCSHEQLARAIVNHQSITTILCATAYQPIFLCHYGVHICIECGEYLYGLLSHGRIGCALGGNAETGRHSPIQFNILKFNQIFDFFNFTIDYYCNEKSLILNNLRVDYLTYLKLFNENN